jgi:hypothetical protein
MQQMRTPQPVAAAAVCAEPPQWRDAAGGLSALRVEVLAAKGLAKAAGAFGSASTIDAFAVVKVGARLCVC